MRGATKPAGGATRAPAPPTAMIYMEPGLSLGYRHEEEEEDKEGLEEEEEEASPGFVDSWLRRCMRPCPTYTYSRRGLRDR